MTNQEFSDAFDVLLNSYNTKADFGDLASKLEIVLDEFEKSVLLTLALDIIVKSYFDRMLNNQNQGFDDSARRQVDFSSLIKVAELSPLDNSNIVTFDDRGKIFVLPNKVVSTSDGSNYQVSEVLFILNEKLKVNGKDYVIVPISYTEYDREMSKPYALPLKKLAWRLFQNAATGFDIHSELIPKWTIARDLEDENIDMEFIYRIRYVKRPRPIVLEDFENLEIDGISTKTTCELNPILHMDILNKAVEMAAATRGRATPTKTLEQR